MMLTDFLMHVYVDYGVKGAIYTHEQKLSSCISFRGHATCIFMTLSDLLIIFTLLYPNFGLIVLYDADC